MAIKNLLVIISITLTFFTLPLSVTAEENRRPNFDSMREKMDTMRADMKNASEGSRMREWDKDGKFKEQIQKMKDGKKKQTTQKVETKLASMAARKQAQLLKAHTQLTTFYDKLLAKQQDLEAAGNDTASAEAALADAKTALDKAKVALSSNSTVPTPDLSNEDTLKQVMKEYVKKVHESMKEEAILLRDAKESLRKASRILTKIEKTQKGATNGPIPTN